MAAVFLILVCASLISSSVGVYVVVLRRAREIAAATAGDRIVKLADALQAYASKNDGTFPIPERWIGVLLDEGKVNAQSFMLPPPFSTGRTERGVARDFEYSAKPRHLTEGKKYMILWSAMPVDLSSHENFEEQGSGIGRLVVFSDCSCDILSEYEFSERLDSQER